MSTVRIVFTLGALSLAMIEASLHDLLGGLGWIALFLTLCYEAGRAP